MASTEKHKKSESPKKHKFPILNRICKMYDKRDPIENRPMSTYNLDFKSKRMISNFIATALNYDSFENKYMYIMAKCNWSPRQYYRHHGNTDSNR